MRKKKIGFLPILGLIALTAGVTYAAVMWYVDIPMTFDIVSGYSLALYEEDGSPLTAIDLGEISQGASVDGGPYGIETTGSVPVYISYSLTDWPSDVTIEVEELDYYGDPAGTIIPDDTPLGPVDPGELWVFYIDYDVAPAAILGTYTPTFTWNSHDTT